MQSNNICSDDVMSCFRIRANEQRVRTHTNWFASDEVENDARKISTNKLRVKYVRAGLSLLRQVSSGDVCPSHEDRQFLNIVRTESRFFNGRSQLLLPFRTGYISVPNNLDQPLLENIEITVCFNQLGIDRVISTSLHHFSDASQIGYGRSGYLHLIDVDERVRCSLVERDSRVALLKHVTIPRLKLTAAALSVEVGDALGSELRYRRIPITYRADGRFVLIGCISNGVRRFHMFATNRMRLIREDFDITTWRYNNSDCGLADDVSRGIFCFNMCEEHHWIREPRFLWEPEDGWPAVSAVGSLSGDGPNLRVRKMTDLPHGRVPADGPPFVGVGFLDSNYHKNRKQLRSVRYACILICSAVLVVLIAVAHSPEAISLLDALQRFTCRQVQRMQTISDNGASFDTG